MACKRCTFSCASTQRTAWPLLAWLACLCIDEGRLPQQGAVKPLTHTWNCLVLTAFAKGMCSNSCSAAHPPHALLPIPHATLTTKCAQRPTRSRQPKGQSSRRGPCPCLWEQLRRGHSSRLGSHPARDHGPCLARGLPSCQARFAAWALPAAEGTNWLMISAAGASFEFEVLNQ